MNAPAIHWMVLAEQATGQSAKLSLRYLLLLLLVSVMVLLFFIIALRMQAFLALILASLVVAVGSCKELTGGAGKIRLTDIGDEIQRGMGSSLGLIATIIGLGAIFGALLEHSGGAQRLARSLLALFGEKRASWAMMLTGFIISIPVFLDVALVILAPIIYALARRTGKSVLAYGLPLVAGLMVTHAFVPPTPGPVWVAYELGVGLGWVIAFGCLVGLPTAIIAGIFLPRSMARRLHIEPPELLDDSLSEPTEAMPGFGLIMLLIGLPIGLILLGTSIKEYMAWDLDAHLTSDQYAAAISARIADAGIVWKLLYFLGHPIIALVVATVAALIFLGYARGYDKQRLMEITTKALGPAGVIILITGAGGVFKGVMGASGVSDALGTVCKQWDLNVLVLAYLFALLVRIAQGSASVAMFTAAGLISGTTAGLSQPELALVVIAIAAGASGVSHVNDSGFWIVSRYLRMTEKQTFSTWTVISTVVSVVGFLLSLMLWYLLPLIGVH